MKTKITNLIIPALSCFLMTESCTTVYHFDAAEFFKKQPYNSDKPFKMKTGDLQAPLLSHKGDVNISFDVRNGFGIHAAVAVSQKVALLLSGSTGSAEDETIRTTTISGTRISTESYDSSFVYGYWRANSNSKHDLQSSSTQTQGADTTYFTQSVDYTIQHKWSRGSIEAAVGLYKTFDKSGRWENYAGFSYGNVKNNYTYRIPYSANYDYRESRNYFQFFIQDNFGYVTAHTEGALITRFSYIHFTNQNFTMDPVYPQNKYEMTADNMLFQPAVRFGVGGKLWRIYIQDQWNLNLTNGSDLSWFGNSVQSGVLFRISSKTNNPVKDTQP